MHLYSYSTDKLAYAVWDFIQSQYWRMHLFSISVRSYTTYNNKMSIPLIHHFEKKKKKELTS